MLLLTTSASGEDFDYSAYQPTSLAEVIANADADPRSDYFDVALPRYKAVAVFTGKTRPIEHRVGDFITMWAKTDQLPASYRDLFKTEVEIKQDSTTYWTPIQESLVESFRHEVALGKKVTLYLLFMGEHKHSAVFAICGFDSAMLRVRHFVYTLCSWSSLGQSASAHSTSSSMDSTSSMHLLSLVA